MNKWTKNLTNMEKSLEYIKMNKNKFVQEEEKNSFFSKNKNNPNQIEKDYSEISFEDLSSSISSASIGQIIKKAFSRIEITESTNNSNKNNFNNNNKNNNKRKLKDNKENEITQFQGSFAISSINGKTILNTIVSKKSQDEKGKINQIKIKSRSIKHRDKDGNILFEKKEEFDNEETGEQKHLYKKKSGDKLFKKINKINTNTGEQEQYIEYENLNLKKSRNKKKREDYEFYFWSYREKDEQKEDNSKIINNASSNKLKVGERKYHKKKVLK